jgi:hypothetical protein
LAAAPLGEPIFFPPYSNKLLALPSSRFALLKSIFLLAACLGAATRLICLHPQPNNAIETSHQQQQQFQKPFHVGGMKVGLLERDLQYLLDLLEITIGFFPPTGIPHSLQEHSTGLLDGFAQQP